MRPAECSPSGSISSTTRSRACGCSIAQTQLSSGKTDALRILPSREDPFDDAAIKAFRERFRERFPVDPTRCPVYRMISEAQLPAGIEYYLPLFFASTVTLLEYLGARRAARRCGGRARGARRLVAPRRGPLRAAARRHRAPILAPRDGFVAPDEIRARLDILRTLTLVAHASEDDGGTDAAPALNAGVTHPLSAGVAASDDRITRWTENEAGERTLLATSSPGHREMMLELLRQRGREPVTFASWQDFLASDAPLGVGVAELGEGLRFPSRKIRLVTSTELGMERPKQRQRRRRARDPETVIRELTELLIGAPIVHEDHGVGRYRGLITLEAGGVPGEYLRSNTPRATGCTCRCAAAPGQPLLRRVAGNGAAALARRRAVGKAQAQGGRGSPRRRRRTAGDLGQRAARAGLAIAVDRTMYEPFAATFPFEETARPARRDRAVIARPRDRRSRWIASSAATSASARPRSRCAPRSSPPRPASRSPCWCRRRCSPSSTTATFRDRFADWPVRVEVLSRFRSAEGDQAETLAGSPKARSTSSIGTHRLLQQDVRFKDLGLVIVDEEHRFGVRQKER